MIFAPPQKILLSLPATGDARGEAHIDSVWVAEAARGFGLGRVLLHQV